MTYKRKVRKHAGQQLKQDTETGEQAVQEQVYQTHTCTEARSKWREQSRHEKPDAEQLFRWPCTFGWRAHTICVSNPALQCSDQLLEQDKASRLCNDGGPHLL